MSVKDEITRLNNAKTDMRNALENKGVSVPSNEKISNYANYINKIQTDGADSSFCSDYIIKDMLDAPISPTISITGSTIQLTTAEDSFDAVLLYVDGNVDSTENQYTNILQIPNVDSGSHEISVAIIKNGSCSRMSNIISYIKG